ncbi:MAG: DUF4337 family protein [Bacteroidota bacterium]
MKQLLFVLSFFLMICLPLHLSALPYTPPTPIGKAVETAKERKQRLKEEKKVNKQINKQIRKKERLQKRAAKLTKRLKKKWRKWQKKRHKKKLKKQRYGGVTDETNFRIGLILLLGGIAGVLVGSIIDFGLLNWLGGLVALAGLVFIIWSLIEYSN